MGTGDIKDGYTQVAWYKLGGKTCRTGGSKVDINI